MRGHSETPGDCVLDAELGCGLAQFDIASPSATQEFTWDLHQPHLWATLGTAWRF